ncbi:RB1-inducible coiled-coil protein 1 isoform X2 [Diorhabda sublineata]|uniref:RB1-inducible coiled-coil protein 1 isoform X2 n=1 Tax=Diorhabda sublineata TaxID=1163346 RepID=UPI0024E17C07|nr:RB1-inducible coiled-coil protein 1 isoform X2 [Diorhabda sublineata]
MLHIFHVDAGQMITLDMNLALETVGNLKNVIQEELNIAANKMVLLISGGISLNNRMRVCSYSAGTDTNPIFLFSKSIIESPIPPLPGLDSASESDIEQKVREHCDMPVTFATVGKRTQLAQHLLELARKHLSICENLVHDQHLQQQGWAAVVANLEDSTNSFRKAVVDSEKQFRHYLKMRDFYIKILKLEDPAEGENSDKKEDIRQSSVVFSISPEQQDDYLKRNPSRIFFERDLEVLKRIPVLPSLLMPAAKTFIENFKASIREDEEASSSTSQTSRVITLFDWINATKKYGPLDKLYEICCVGVQQIDKQLYQSLSKDFAEVIKNADNIQMKEIKGLGERLSGLETLMREAKKLVKQQAELTLSFVNNQSRASNTKDPSVLPDLCTSHKKQLAMMASYHAQICDIRRRCAKAKEELSINLYHRLKWVMYIEDRVTEAYYKMDAYGSDIDKLKYNIGLLQQMHMCPTYYLSALTEVVRRRTFSQQFLLWASELACRLLAIYNEEVTRRKEFRSQFQGHFLNVLFPGMEDLPPNFATQAPPMFDMSLPPITQEDIDTLKTEIPDLADKLNVPDTKSYTNFFLLNSLTRKEEETEDTVGNEEALKAVEEKLIQAVNDVGLASDLDKDILRCTGSEPCLTTAVGITQHKELDKGCESETDTEEFEKVCQSPPEPNFDRNIPSLRPHTQDASTSTEVSDNKTSLPPKKPPRTFQQKPTQQEHSSCHTQRTLSVSSNTDSFTNIKHPSLESIEEISNVRPTDSCFNSHYHGNPVLRSKSISPHTPQSPQVNSPLGHQTTQNLAGVGDFSNDEFYIDESLPSSLSIETGHSQGSEFIKQLDTAHNVVALLQDNLQISRTEHDRLKNVLGKLHQLAMEATLDLRSELSALKTHVLATQNCTSQYCDSLTNSWENLIVLREQKEKDTLESITKNHEDAIKELSKREEENNKQIENLLNDKVSLENDLLKSRELLEELKENLVKLNEENIKIKEDLQNQLLEKDQEMNKLIKETSDRLVKDHKAEIENIRSRFKLMTMERSPSDNTFEKSLDSNNLQSNSTFLQQMKDNFDLEKEKAVNDAVEQERTTLMELMDNRIREIESKFLSEKNLALQDLAIKISEEKDKQIEVLMEREKNLTLECIKYKGTIQQLAESATESSDVELLKMISTLQSEKEALIEELENSKMSKDKSIDMSTSVAVCEAKVDVTTSPMKRKDEKKSEYTQKGIINIESCKPGDRVIVCWDKDHENFRVVQDKQHLYFLHSDYLEELGFEINENGPNKFFCIGEVINKEYCYARKSDNRYKVPKCTKFFRVKVRPPTALARDVTQSLYQPSSSQNTLRMTRSQSAASSYSEDDKPATQLPSTYPISVILEGDQIDGSDILQDRDICQDHCNIQENKSEHESENNEKLVQNRVQWPEQHFAEDSGIVENVEEVMAAFDNTPPVEGENKNTLDVCDRNFMVILIFGLVFYKIYEVFTQIQT